MAHRNEICSFKKFVKSFPPTSRLEQWRRWHGLVFLTMIVEIMVLVMDIEDSRDGDNRLIVEMEMEMEMEMVVVLDSDTEITDELHN